MAELKPHNGVAGKQRHSLVPPRPQRNVVVVPAPEDDGPPVELGLILPHPDEVKAAVRKRQAHVRSQAEYFVDEAERLKFLLRHDVLGFADYCDAVGKRDRHLRALERADLSLGPDDSAALRLFLKKIFDHELHTPDFRGWLNYLAFSPDVANVLNNLEGAQYFPESTRRMHTLIAARNGWGKSELMKALVWHYLHDDDAAVVVLDPHGDMAREMARTPAFMDSGRVVLVEPGLREGYTVGINPLDGSRLDDEAKSARAAAVVTAIGDLSADMSSNMRMVARACVRVLLDVPGVTLYDLAMMLNPTPRGAANKRPPDPRQTYLLELGRRHPERAVSDFFKYELDAEGLESSVTAVRHRVRDLLSIPQLAAMLGGAATLDLEQAIEDRKVILVNLDPLGTEGGAVMGRLLIDMVAAIGRGRGKREKADRVPVHLFVDEATIMVSPAIVRILTQLRKFGVHLTMAQQLGASGFAGDARQEVMQGTACKFAGGTDTSEIARILQTDARDLPPLERGEFWVRWGNAAPARLMVRRDLAGLHHDTTEEDWQRFVDEMVADYYRPARTAANTFTGAAETTEAWRAYEP